MESNGLDSFRLVTYQNLGIDERNVFTLLYQPIIGCDAFTLYLTLWSFIERSRSKNPEFKHFKLYDILRLSPKTFVTARRKLEAIGLIVTYHKDDFYLYELKAPLTAEEFIKDGSLGAYLFSKIGKENFESLTELFRVTPNDKDGFTNITSHFTDVFDALPKPIETKQNYSKKTKSKIKIVHNFDFDVFLDGLSKNFVDKRKITKSIRQKIINLSYVYNLDEFTMQRVFMDSVDRNKNIKMDMLSYNAREWYEFDREEVVVGQSKPSKKSITHTQIIQKCKSSTPHEIFELLLGVKPGVRELGIVEDIVEKYAFSNEVINFLVVYVLGTVEHEIPSFKYFDTVASSWNIAQVTTIEQALNVIKQRQKRFEEKKQHPRKKQNQKVVQDVEADWFDEYIKNR